jgi:quinol monooxygenase YgiN
MSNSDIIVMTTVKTKPGKEQDVLQASLDVAKAARTQSGCVDYRILRSAEDAALTINFERWSSKEERDAFNAGPDVEKFIAAVSGAFAESPQPVSYQAMD